MDGDHGAALDAYLSGYAEKDCNARLHLACALSCLGRIDTDLEQVQRRKEIYPGNAGAHA
jgi:hypothetical protein